MSSTVVQHPVEGERVSNRDDPPVVHRPRSGPTPGARTADGSTIVATRHNGGRRRKASSLVIGGLLSTGAMGLVTATSTGSAHASNGAIFSLGILTVLGDAQDNNLAISRDAAGKILINGGAVSVLGGTPTVANTRSILVLGLAGNDTLTMDEVNGALPKVTMIGGAG